MPNQATDPRLALDLDATLTPESRTSPVTAVRAPVARFADATGPVPAPVNYGYGGYGYGGASVGDDAVHLMDYVRALHKRRWIALSTFLVVFGTVTLLTYTATPLYDANVQILIENENPNVVKIDEVYDQNKATNDYYQTQYRILQSRLLARRTIEAEKLWDHPLLTGRGGRRSISLNPMVWAAQTWSMVRGFFPRQPVAQPTPEAAETAAQSSAIGGFLAGLSVVPVRNSRLVDIRYRSPDPQFAARAANAIAREFIAQNLEFRFLATKEATEFLNARMTEQRKSLDQSEQALQKYREQTGAVALEDRQNIVVQRLVELNAAVTRARTERIEREAVYNQIIAIQNDRAALDTIPAVMGNTFVQQLKGQLSELQRQEAQLSEKLGQRHPDILKVRTAIETTDSRISAEIQKIIQALRIDYQASLANERQLQESLNRQRGEAQEINRAAIQYSALQRDTTSNTAMFEGLLQRRLETGISGELKTSNIRVVDQAEVPRGPSSPNKRNNMLLAIFGGALLGVGLAFFFEYLDNRIKAPEEIKNHLGLPFLGLVPALEQKPESGPPLLNAGVSHHFSEAFGALRTNVLFSSADEGPKSLVITSTAPGEGKTVVSANLAMSLAGSGQRVLLVDADMRRPKLHEFFRIRREPGLSNILVGDGKASEAVKKTTVPNLWVMAAGKHPPNPAELLGSKRFKEFMASLGNHFDFIILDSPPVMAVTDASVLSHIATGVVFVIGAEMTSRGAAKAALNQLDSAKARYIGGVLNKVDLRSNSYYYAHYYRREYNNYYGTSPTQK